MKNARSLNTIADDIHRLERRSIFDIGDLLIEAKAQCEHGDWLGWLFEEFEWSSDTAARYMNVARLGLKFRKLRNLKLTKSTLYELAERDDDDEDLPAIVEELAKSAAKKRLFTDDAQRVIKVGIGRRRFGDLPDATLAELGNLNEFFSEAFWHEQAVAALLERKPETDESATLITREIRDQLCDAGHKDEEDPAPNDPSEETEREEADAILDGPPPALPPPTAPPEPQKLSTDTDWAETTPFVDAVRKLLELHTKPIARFAGIFPPDQLLSICLFLTEVAADKKEAA